MQHFKFLQFCVNTNKLVFQQFLCFWNESFILFSVCGPDVAYLILVFPSTIIKRLEPMLEVLCIASVGFLALYLLFFLLFTQNMLYFRLLLSAYPLVFDHHVSVELLVQFFSRLYSSSFYLTLVDFAAQFFS